ncbi:MAG TPA: hypothetical protein VM103_02855 [Candidatus Paceibacterota bacterium]|nr:hypothetical protein [Candidatus Paceibacterota bacterium]
METSNGMDKPRISFDEFSKIQVKVGTVRTAERVPETDKLFRLTVDFGIQPAALAAVPAEAAPEATSPVQEQDVRQIVSGIAAYVSEPSSLIGRQLAFVTNLEPRTIKGLESNGMLFAVGEGDSFAFLTPSKEVPPGTAAH